MRGEGCAVCHTSSSVKPRRLRVTGVNISQHVSDIRSSFLLPGVSSAPLYLGRGKMGMGWLTFAYYGKNTHTHTHTQVKTYAHTQTHTHTRTKTHTHTHTHTHKHTHSYACFCVFRQGRGRGRERGRLTLLILACERVRT